MKQDGTGRVRWSIWLAFLFPLLLHAQLNLREPAYIAASQSALGPTPATLSSNLFVWWKSDSTGSNYSNGNPVNRWTNSMPPSLLLTVKNGGDAARAVFSNNWFGSYPAICFDGVNDSFFISNSVSSTWENLSVLRPYTAIVIGRTPGGGTVMSSSVDNLSNVGSVGFGVTNWMRIFQDPTYPVVTIGVSFTNKFMAVFQSRSGPAENRFYNDLATGTNLTTSVDGAVIEVGSQATFGGFYKWELAEFIIFTNNYLTGAQITNLYNNYAKPRYGLP